MTESIRQSILRAVGATLSAHSVGVVPYFPNVKLGPLGSGDFSKHRSVGIVPLSEQEKHLYPFVQCRLRLGLELQVTVNRGDEVPLMELEKALTELKLAICADRTFGGIVIDTEFEGTETDLTTYGDKTPAALRTIAITYRHSVNDPRSAAPT